MKITISINWHLRIVDMRNPQFRLRSEQSEDQKSFRTSQLYLNTKNVKMKIHIYSRQNVQSVHDCCQQMCTVPEKWHARLELSLWNWLSSWPKLSGVKQAAVPLWHINLYGQLTLEHWSQALSSHRALSLSLVDSSTLYVLFFCTPLWNYDPEKFPTGIQSWQMQRLAGILNLLQLVFEFTSVALKAIGSHLWFSLLV